MAATGYNCEIYRSIHEIEASVWDAIVPEQELFHQHRFIRVVEDAKVEDSRYWYLLFYEQGTLVASAVLSAFRVDLELFLDDGLKNWILRIRRRLPHFFSPLILCCGLPVSLGQKNLVISRRQSDPELLRALTGEMDKICREYKIRYQCLKEFRESQLPLVEEVVSLGFFRGYSIPYMQMDIHWTNFGQYLGDLRHHYRRLIKRSLKKIRLNQETGKLLIHEDLDEPLNDVHTAKAQIKINNWAACPPDLFYRLYCEVMERAETKLEMLNETFFENCWEYLRDEAYLITLEKQGNILSAGLLFHRADCLTFALIGKEKFKDQEHDPYFNLVYGIIELACRLGCKRLKLGQTAYWVKQRVGGQPEDMFLFFKAKNPLLHFFLRRFSHTLFPPLPLKKVRPFKAGVLNPVAL